MCVDGRPANERVVASINGQLCGETQTSSFSLFSPFVISIASDATQRGCGVSGASVAISIMVGSRKRSDRQPGPAAHRSSPLLPRSSSKTDFPKPSADHHVLIASLHSGPLSLANNSSLSRSAGPQDERCPTDSAFWCARLRASSYSMPTGPRRGDDPHENVDCRWRVAGGRTG